MAIMNSERLGELVSLRSDHCLSLYFAPVSPENSHAADRAHLCDLLAQAETELLADGAAAKDVERILAPASLLTEADLFWSRCCDGVALFAARDWFRVFHVLHRFREEVMVDSRFCLRPLLPILQDDARFYILALTAEDACLYEATRYSIRRILLPLGSNGQIGAKGQDTGGSRQIVNGNGNGHRNAQQRDAGRSHETDLMRFYQQVDRAVRANLHQLNAPLLLACVGYISQLYEAANSYPHLLKEKVPGSPNIWSMTELREQAWHMVEPRFRKRREQAANAYSSAAATGRASYDLCEVAAAAKEGRVASLLIKPTSVWCDTKRPRRRLELSAERKLSDEELVDYAVAQTLSHGGDVFRLLSVPAPVAAIFRY